MTMSERDKKLIFLIVPIALIIAYWFLVLSPKREESAAVQTELQQAQSEQQQAEAQVATLSKSKNGFTDAYTTVVRLGKAVPANVDMPSLIVQLDRAARGTDITFDKISTGERTAVTTGESTTTTADPAAASGTGQTAQNAQQGVDNANATNGANAAAANGSDPNATGATPAPAALESIPLDFTFNGQFFELADFFHRMKRFVKVVNDDIVVRGRLMTIDSLTFKVEQDSFPYIRADVKATVYLAPRAEGVTAGASPTGPNGSATPSPSAPAPSGGGSGTPNPATSAPAATVK
jgi:Tfp pilus assembly protein PilO